MLKEKDQKMLQELSELIADESKMNKYIPPVEYPMIQSVMSILNKKDKISRVYFYYQIELTLLKLNEQIKENESLSYEHELLSELLENAKYEEDVYKITNLIKDIDKKVFGDRENLNFIIKR